MTNDGTDDTPLARTQQAFNANVDSLVALGYALSGPRTRSIAYNRRVKGQPRSQHLIGLAADFSVPQNIPAFVEAARRRGLVALPEVPRPGESAEAYYARTGHRPHIHVQRFRYGQTPKSFYAAAGIISED